MLKYVWNLKFSKHTFNRHTLTYFNIHKPSKFDQNRENLSKLLGKFIMSLFLPHLQFFLMY